MSNFLKYLSKKPFTGVFLILVIAACVTHSLSLFGIVQQTTEGLIEMYLPVMLCGVTLAVIPEKARDDKRTDDE